MNIQNLPISKVFFRIAFVFRQRPVTVCTSTFFGNPDTKNILRNDPSELRLVQKIPVYNKILVPSINIKHFMR